MNIASISKDNKEKSQKLYKRAKQDLEDFYELCKKFEKKANKLKLLGLWNNYVEEVNGYNQLIHNISKGFKWNGYEVLYCPKGIDIIGREIYEEISGKLLVIGFAKLKSFNNIVLNITHLILACDMVDNYSFGSSLIGDKLKDIRIHFRVYDERHILLPAYRLSSFQGMFENNERLRRIVLVDGDYSKVKSMRYTFYGCTSLKDIYIENIESSKKIGSISYAFGYCKSLTAINLSNLYLMNCDSFASVFELCIRLRTIKIGNMHNGAYGNKTINGCMSLEVLDSDGWIPRSDINYILNNCISLRKTSIPFINSIIEDKIKYRRLRDNKLRKTMVHHDFNE